MSPIERAAEAMFVALRGTNELACCGKWSAERFAEYTGRHEEGWVYVDGPIKLDALVRAVLQAIREPSEGMLAAAKPEPTHLYGGIARDADFVRAMKAATEVDQLGARQDWQAMIDAALSE